MHKYTAMWFDWETSEINKSFWEGNERKVESESFEWYFYAKNSEIDKVVNEQFLNRIGGIEKMDSQWTRIYCKPGKWSKEWLLAEMAKHGAIAYESDVDPVTRYMIDNRQKYEFETNLRQMYFDLETDGRKGWEKKLEHPILTSAFCDFNGEYSCHMAEDLSFEAEKNLLKGFLKVMSEHDLIISWNGDEYDEPLLKQRCKVHGLMPEWRMLNFLDLMKIFQHPYFGFGRDDEGTGVKVSYALGNIGERLLGMGKTEQISPSLILQLFQNERERLEKYNVRDVQIMVELEKKHKFVDGLKTISHLCNRFLSSHSVKTGYLNDSFIMGYGSKKCVHFLPRPDKKDDEEHIQIKGAYVMEPVTGVHDGVCVLDFSSLYPNIIRTFNISPETKGAPTGATTSNNVVFSIDKLGIFPAMVEMSLKQRKEWKKKALALAAEGKEGTDEHRFAKQRSDAYKVIGNSLYGIMSSTFHRYYDAECGEAVTSVARELIALVIDEVRSRGFLVLYSDTDSVYVICTQEQAQEFVECIAKKVDERVKERGGFPGMIRLSFTPKENRYERLVLIAKKKYVGKKETGKFEWKGLEYVRSDGCKAMRELQEEIVKELFVSNDCGKVCQLISEKKRRLFEGEIGIADLVLSPSVGRSLESYKVKPIQAKIAEEMLKNGKEVYEGMKIPYVITGKDKTRLLGKHIDDCEGKYDAVIYWKQKIWPATEKILEVVYPEDPQWKALGIVKEKSQTVLFKEMQ